MAVQEMVDLGSGVDQGVRLGEVSVSAQSMHPWARTFPIGVQNNAICWHLCTSAALSWDMHCRPASTPMHCQMDHTPPCRK